MAAGFQSIGDTGSYQIDSNFKNLAMIRKGTVSTSVYLAGDATNSRPTRAAVTLNPGEILAFSCTSPCALASRVGSVAYLHVDASAGSVVNYYIFTSGTSQSNFGLQVFNENSELTFDSSWKLFDVRAVISGYGNQFVGSRGSLAVVHSQINSRVDYVKVVNGQPPNSLTSWVRTTAFSCASISGGAITTSLSLVDSWARAPTAGGSSPFSVSYNNNVTPIFLAIDVTGF